MAHAIRGLMARMDVGALFGEVEADETYVGGKAAGKRGRGAGGKTVVLGCKQRQGPVRTWVVRNAQTRTIKPIVCRNVCPGSMVYTDEWHAYRRLSQRGYCHRSVKHGAKQWVDGACHTNSIEGYWSQLKRSIEGIHVHVSGKHLHRYLKEFDFRHNTRKTPDQMFDLLVEMLCRERPA